MQRVAVFVVLAVVALGCGRADAGQPQPPFAAVPAVGGGQINGGELAGRDLALWFWAPW